MHAIDTYGDNRSPTLAAFQNTPINLILDKEITHVYYDLVMKEIVRASMYKYRLVIV